MAGCRFKQQSSVITLAGVKRTVLQLHNLANLRSVIKEWSVSFSGGSPDDPPSLVQIMRQTTAGTGGDTQDPTSLNPGDTSGPLAAGEENVDGTDPTDDEEVMSEYVSATGGYTWQAPFGYEIQNLPNERIAIVITPGVSGLKVKARFMGEE